MMQFDIVEEMKSELKRYISFRLPKTKYSNPWDEAVIVPRALWIYLYRVYANVRRYSPDTYEDIKQEEGDFYFLYGEKAGNMGIRLSDDEPNYISAPFHIPFELQEFIINQYKEWGEI